MAIIRAARPENHFTQIRNDVLRDDRLSYRARGVLAVILSRPDDWATSAEALTRDGSEGRDALRTALSELEAAGYLLREKRQDARGRWATVAVVYDQPQQASHVEPQLPGMSDSQPPTTGFQASVNQPSVSQALSTNTVKNTGPTDQREAAPADAIAKAVHDATGGMINFMAVRQIAVKAMKLKPAPTVAQVIQVMTKIDAEGRTITMQAVGQALRGSGSGGIIQPQTDTYWREGGAF